MTGQDIINKVRSLGWPKDSYIVFGSGPMALAGIRESSDIDFLVSPELLQTLKQEGWKQIEKNTNDKPLIHDVFEAHDNWNFSSYNPTLEQLLSRATIADGVPFASLEDVRKWKAAGKRPKDVQDIALIDAFRSS